MPRHITVFLTLVAAWAAFSCALSPPVRPVVVPVTVAPPEEPSSMEQPPPILQYEDDHDPLSTPSSSSSSSSSGQPEAPGSKPVAPTFPKIAPRATFSRSAAAARRQPPSPKPFKPHGGIYHRRENNGQILLSGVPDPWFTGVMRTEPEDLTLDQVEDMTDLELMDYVGQFNWGMKPPSTNVVKVLLRREALAQIKHRRHPGDEHEEHTPLWDTEGAHDIKIIGESRPHDPHADSDEATVVAPEDRLMSYPRWHLERDKQLLETDEYYNKRRTKRQRPTIDPHTVGKVNAVETVEVQRRGFQGQAALEGNDEQATASDGLRAPPRVVKKRAVIPTVDIDGKSKMVQGDAAPNPHYGPKKTRSNVKRRAAIHYTSREERDKMRQQWRSLPTEKRVEMHQQQDPGRCYVAASDFCGGMQNHFADFMRCALDNAHKFHEQDDYCKDEFAHFYGPCVGDMVEHCPDLDSFDTHKCLTALAKVDAQSMETEGVESTTIERRLSSECLTSEGLDVMIASVGARDANWELSDAERRMIVKYQEFWLSQQHENLPDHEKDDYLGHFEVRVKEEHETEFPDTGFGDAFDRDEDAAAL